MVDEGHRLSAYVHTHKKWRIESTAVHNTAELKTC